VSDVTGVLLAGGASRRFPPNKLLHTYEGGPLFWRPLRALATACGEIVLVLATGAAEPQLPLLGTSVRVVRDPAADQGPLVALASALNGVTTEWALLVGGDMPDIKPALLGGMAERARASTADVVAQHDPAGSWRRDIDRPADLR
jgi:molybdopterin-guanine dinucleotide biosynthesis protein A